MALCPYYKRCIRVALLLYCVTFALIVAFYLVAAVKCVVLRVDIARRDRRSRLRDRARYHRGTRTNLHAPSLCAFCRERYMLCISLRNEALSSPLILFVRQ